MQRAPTPPVDPVPQQAMGPLVLPASMVDPAARSPSSPAVIVGPAADVEDPCGVFALSYTRGWLAGGPWVNPCDILNMLTTMISTKSLWCSCVLLSL